MKNYISIFTGALFSYAFIAAQTQEAPKQYKPRYIRQYFGPDIFVEHLHSHFSYRGDSGNYSSTTVFSGFRWGYNYYRPRAFYNGADFLFAFGSSSEKSRTTYWNWSKNGYDTSNADIKTTPLFINFEERFGYTFQSPLSPQSTLVPFAGIGYYLTRAQYDEANPSAFWFYSALGLKISQQFSSYCNIEFNAKALYSFGGSRLIKIDGNSFKEKMDNAWGYEIAIPVTWQIGPSKKWGIQFQPYVLKLDINTRSWILGTRLVATYCY